jgi:hypothetical protein
VLQVEIVDQQQDFVPDKNASVLGKVLNRLPKAPSILRLEIGDGSSASFTVSYILDSMDLSLSNTKIDVIST